MTHTIKTLTLAAAVGAVLAGGCNSCPVQKKQNQPPVALNDTPVIIDEAMQIRQWDVSTAKYQNGDTFAGPTMFAYEPKWNQPEWHYQFIDTPLFLTQLAGMPIMLFVTPPGKDLRYTGETIEPTYTAMPVLPPSMNVVESAPAAEPAPMTETPTTAP